MSLLLPHGGTYETHQLAMQCPTIQCATDIESQAWELPYTYKVKIYAPGTYAAFPWPDSYHKPMTEDRDA